MTDTIIDEIWRVTEAALKEGQEHIPIHSFPFRMTDENMARFASSEWREFWVNLKEGYDAFERTRLPPKVSVCDKRYAFQEITPPEVGDTGPLAVCGETLAAIQTLEPFLHPVLALSLPRSRTQLIQRARQRLAVLTAGGPASRGGAAKRSRQRAATASLRQSTTTSCSPARASCRRFIALQGQQRRTAQARLAARARGPASREFRASLR
jgi:hypothetical protein